MFITGVPPSPSPLYKVRGKFHKWITRVQLDFILQCRNITSTIVVHGTNAWHFYKIPFSQIYDDERKIKLYFVRFYNYVCLLYYVQAFNKK